MPIVHQIHFFSVPKLLFSPSPTPRHRTGRALTLRERAARRPTPPTTPAAGRRPRSPVAELGEVRADCSTEQAIDLRQELGEVELGRASGTGCAEVGSVPVSLSLREPGISFAS